RRGWAGRVAQPRAHVGAVVGPVARRGSDPGAQVGSRVRPERRVTVGVPVDPTMQTRLTVQTLDLHTGGEPLRLIVSGYPPMPAAPILERRRWALDQADHVRRIVCFEPRGHRDMYAAVLAPPHRPDADVAVLFMHNE